MAPVSGSIVDVEPLSTCSEIPVEPSGLPMGALANALTTTSIVFWASGKPRHVVELDEDVPAVRLRAHRGQVDVDRPVAVRVDPVPLPLVPQRVAVRVGERPPVREEVARVGGHRLHHAGSIVRDDADAAGLATEKAGERDPLPSGAHVG